jgi:hypothetical protein
MKRWLFCCMGILFGTHLLDAQVDFSGYGAAGYKWYDRTYINGYNNKTYYEGKLQAEIVITKHVDAKLDFRGHSDDSSVEFREFSAKFGYFKDVKIKIGNLRKPFGMEQFVDNEERDAIDESYIHRELSDRGYAGRAVMLTVYHKYKKNHEDALPYSYYVSLYKDNALAFGAIARVEYHNNDWIVGGGVFLQHNGVGSEITTIAASGDVSFDFDRYQPLLEVIYAQDPIEELQRRVSGVLENVNVLGIRTVHKFICNTNSTIITSVQPFVLVGCFIPDLKTAGTHTFQANLGVNVYFEPNVRFRVNTDLLLHKTIYATRYETYDSRVTAEVQVCF